MTKSDSGGGKFGPGVGVAFVVVAIALLGYQLLGRSSDKTPIAPKTVFYTDDQGKSFFKDEVKIVPFDHNGKQALRADVFKGPDGKEFVGLIYRFTDPGRREMEGYLSAKTPDPQGLARLAIEHRGMQVKPVGTESWMPADSETCERLQTAVKSPGGGSATLVTP